MKSAELYLTVLLIVFAVPYVIWRILGRRLWAPLVIVQILVGILFGPTILGGFLPGIYSTLFHKDVVSSLNGVALWAVMIFVWLAGLELDLREAWHRRGETCIVALFGLLMPLLFGVVAAAILISTGILGVTQSANWQIVLGIGMACAVTALPILILFMENMSILRTDLGQRILRYASLDDVAIWGVLALILLNWEQMAKQVGFLVLFAPAAALARTIFVAAQDRDRWYLGFIWLALCGLSADWAGLHYMVGAFLAGVVLDSRWFRIEAIDAFRGFVLIAVMPAFFLSTGLRTSWSVGDLGVFLAAGLLLVASVSGKLFGMYIAGRFLGWSRGEASVIGWLLQTKALIMIIFSNILLDKGVISSDTFTALLLMAVGSTMLTMPVVNTLLKKVHIDVNVRVPQYSNVSSVGQVAAAADISIIGCNVALDESQRSVSTVKAVGTAPM